MTEWSQFISRQTIQHYSNPSLCPNHWYQRSWSWPVLWRPTTSSRINTTHTHTHKCSFHHRGLECKSRKPRDTWNSRQVWPWSTKWNRAYANRISSREHTGHSKAPLSTTQKDSSTHGRHQTVNTEIRLIIFFSTKMGKLYTVGKNKTWSWLWLGSSTSHCIKVQTKIE